jgi:hypothetical protein
MDYISQFANEQATQEQMDNNPKLKSLAMQMFFAFDYSPNYFFVD